MLSSEKGAVLPTVLILMFLMSTLLIGAGYYINQDASNNQLLADSYKLKTMFNLAENALHQSDTADVNYQFVFNHGEVYAEFHPPTHYKLIGTLSSGYQADKMIDSPHAETGPMVDPLEDEEHGDDAKVFEDSIKE